MIRWYYYLTRWTVIVIFRLFTRLKIEGLENVPPEGALLMVANHMSNADAPLVSVTLKRNAAFMAKEELFHNRLAAGFLGGCGAFPVHRGQLDRKALRQSESVLKNGLILVMFPEASRSRDARLKTAFPGSALIAMRHGVPVIPAGITGTENISGFRWILHRHRVTILFGKPFSLPPYEDRRNRSNLEDSTRIIMEHIAELLPEKYRGVYAEKDK